MRILRTSLESFVLPLVCKPDTIRMQPTSLSSNDAAVLGALFDPEASLSDSIKVEDSSPDGLTDRELESIQRQETEALQPLNTEDPSEDDIVKSISNIDHLIEQYPNHASAWNNRGQARRMLFNTRPLQTQSVLLRSIVEDLDQAITIASPESPHAPVSHVNAKVLASAHTHRGLLFWAASRSEELHLALTTSVERLAGANLEMLEEIASHEFALGGRYGNEMARQVAVKTNPYAKLCGNIVKEAMEKEISDFYQIPIATAN